MLMGSASVMQRRVVEFALTERVDAHVYARSCRAVAMYTSCFFGGPPASAHRQGTPRATSPASHRLGEFDAAAGRGHISGQLSFLSRAAMSNVRLYPLQGRPDPEVSVSTPRSWSRYTP